MGLIDVKNPFSGKKYMALSLIIPVLTHGFYDYCCTVGSSLAVIVFYAFLLFLYIYCFGKIKSISKIDGPDNKVVAGLLAKKYPNLFSNLLSQAIENANEMNV